MPYSTARGTDLSDLFPCRNSLGEVNAVVADFLAAEVAVELAVAVGGSCASSALTSGARWPSAATTQPNPPELLPHVVRGRSDRPGVTLPHKTQGAGHPLQSTSQATPPFLLTATASSTVTSLLLYSLMEHYLGVCMSHRRRGFPLRHRPDPSGSAIGVRGSALIICAKPLGMSVTVVK
jgi:hypothetical protein